MIRPIDLQTTILSAQAAAPTAHRAEDGSRLGAQAAQGAFAAELTHRDESVAPTAEVLGNKIGDKPKDGDGHRHGPHARTPGSAFEPGMEESTDDGEELPHIVDCTA